MSDKLQQAISLIKSGEKKQGKRLLGEVIEEDPSNEKAWLWMSSLVARPEKKQYCLERALAINPENQKARKALADLKQAPVAQVKQAPIPQQKAEGVVFAPPAPIQTYPPFTQGLTSQQKTKSPVKVSAKTWIYVILMVLVTIFGVVREVFKTVDEFSLRTSGEVIPGVVVDTFSSNRSRYGDRQYYVVYNYQISNGQVYKSRETVPKTEWEYLQSNPEIQVLYLPTNPSTSRLFRSADDMGPITGLLLNYCGFSVLLLLSGLFLIFGYERLTENWRI